MVDITTTSFSSANSAVSENKSTIIFTKIGHHQQPHRHHPDQTEWFFPGRNSIRTDSFHFSLSSTLWDIMAAAILVAFDTYPSPGHLSSQWFVPESWQTLGIALFTASPWLWFFDQFHQKRPVDWPNLGKCSLPLSLWAEFFSCLDHKKYRIFSFILSHHDKTYTCCS